jgi:hypothetical protein
MTAEKYSFYGVDVHDESTGFVLYEIYLENCGAKTIPEFIRRRMKNLKADQWEPLSHAELMENPDFQDKIGEWDGHPIRLRHECSVLPYRVHGGRELDLMMKGLKPLSVFTYVERSSSLERFLFRYFEPLVERRKLVSRKVPEEGGGSGATTSTIMYALPNEAWRVEAYALMALAARDCKWNDALERIQGLLLGYTREQNNSWMAYRKRNGCRWGLQAVYKILTDVEVASVRKTGCKAFLSDGNSIHLYLPHHSDGQNDPSAALANGRNTTLARFYLPMVRFIEFSRGVNRESGVDFEIFEIPGSSLAKLNELIDGIIEIIEPTAPGP